MNHPQTTNKFEIKTEVFEGPLDLLLDLVEKRKLLINDISLAEVTDDYLKEVAFMQEMSLPNTSQFVSLAATLLLIKSKSLLPILDLSEDEKNTIEDLGERLRLYQIYRDASRDIIETFGVKILREKQYVPNKKPVFTPDEYCNTDALQEAMQRVLVDLPIKEVKPRAQVKQIISLEEMVARLHQRIEEKMKLNFSDLLGQNKEKTTMIVGFLAVLESVKQGSILVAQMSRFSEIEIEREKSSIPKYY